MPQPLIKSQINVKCSETVQDFNRSRAFFHLTNIIHRFPTQRTTTEMITNSSLASGPQLTKIDKDNIYL